MSFWKKPPSDESASSNPQNKGETPLVLSSTDSKEAGATPVKLTPSTPEDVLSQRFGKIRSALSEGTVIQGKLSFDTPVRIDGKLSGEIFSSRALIIGNTGQVDAQVEVSTLIILGSLKGNVRASERIELWAGGKIDGDISTPVLVIEDGCQFSGSCTMKVKAKETQPVASAPSQSASESAAVDASKPKDPNKDKKPEQNGKIAVSQPSIR